MTYHFIYKTVNSHNGNFYIGKHSTSNTDDGYLGSGQLLQAAIKKYGKNAFKKEILFFCNSEKQLNIIEASIVNEDLIKDPKCYNIALGGQGGRSVALCITPEMIKVRSAKSGLTQRGRSKETHHYIRDISAKLKGRTKDTHSGVASMSIKKQGLTKDNHIGVAAGAAKKRGRSKADFDYLKSQGEKQSIKMTGALNPAAKIWILEAPNKVMFTVDNLPVFCKTHELNYTTIQNRGNRNNPTPITRGNSKGWKVLNCYLNKN